MAVILGFGRTQSGKSYRAGEMIKKRDKVIIFDPAACFDGGTVVTDFSTENFKKLLKQNMKKKKFRLVFRPPYSIKDEVAAQAVASFAFAIGRSYGLRSLPDGARIVVLLDEADKYSSYSKSDLLSLLVTKGRHENLDTLALCQSPMRLPTFFRANASMIFTLQLESNAYFQEKFGRKITDDITRLPQWHYFMWQDHKANVALFSPKGKLIKEVEK